MLIDYFSSIISICLYTVKEEAVIGLTAHKFSYGSIIDLHCFDLHPLFKGIQVGHKTGALCIY